MAISRFHALVQEKADLLNEYERITDTAGKENRALTEAEQKRGDEIVASVKALEPQIEREKFIKAQRAAQTGVSIPDGARIEGERDEHHPFKSLGEQLSAVVTAKKAPHAADPRIEKYNRLMAATGMHEGGLAEGGAFVQTEFSNTLIEKTYEGGKVLARIPDQPIGANANAYSALMIKESSRATGSRYGGLRVYRVGEGGSITASRPEFERKEYRPHKLAALCYLTDELVQDAVALEGHVRRLFPLEARFVMENEVFRGTGVGQSLGILNAPAKVEVSKETGQAAATLVYKNLTKMYKRLWPGSESNAVWYANKDTFDQWLDMYIAAGTSGIPPKGVEFVNGRFIAFGSPVEWTEYCSTLGTVGDLVLADVSQYLAISKGALRTDASIHVAFTTDEMALRFVWRWNAEPTWSSALTPANGTGTQSPFITLATRA